MKNDRNTDDSFSAKMVKEMSTIEFQFNNIPHVTNIFMRL